MLRCLFFFFFISNKLDFFQLFDAIKMGCELAIGSAGVWAGQLRLRSDSGSK